MLWDVIYFEGVFGPFLPIHATFSGLNSATTSCALVLAGTVAWRRRSPRASIRRSVPDALLACLGGGVGATCRWDTRFSAVQMVVVNYFWGDDFWGGWDTFVWDERPGCISMNQGWTSSSWVIHSRFFSRKIKAISCSFRTNSFTFPGFVCLFARRLTVIPLRYLDTKSPNSTTLIGLEFPNLVQQEDGRLLDSKVWFEVSCILVLQRFLWGLDIVCGCKL